MGASQPNGSEPDSATRTALRRSPVSDEQRGLAASSGHRRVRITATSWEPVGELEFADWREQARKLATLARGVQWWLGDLLNYGERAFGEKYTEAVEITGYRVGTLMNFAWLASRFPAGRRREDLSFSHHEAVAALEPEAADELLERAAAEGWSRGRLLAEVRQTPAELGRASSGKRKAIPATSGSVLHATVRLKFDFSDGSVTQGRTQLEKRLAMLRDRAADLGLRVMSCVAD